MKSNWNDLEGFRVGKMSLWSSERGDHFGAFTVLMGRKSLHIIASEGAGAEMPWEHVSVHTETWEGKRTPTWAEMCEVKNLFWDEEEVVIQYHPAKSQYINNHPNVLHLWKPVGITLPTPPMIAVGIKT
jgi:hypothetical protein